MVFNVTLKIISVISWLSVLLMERPIVICTTYYYQLALLQSDNYYVSWFSLLGCSVVYLVLTSVVSFSCIMGALRNPSAPIPHNSLHSSPFYLKGPRTAATEKPSETRGHPGCNDKSKNYPRAHKRRIKLPISMGQRFQESPDSVSPTMHQLSILIKNPLIVIIHIILPLKYY